MLASTNKSKEKNPTRRTPPKIIIQTNVRTQMRAKTSISNKCGLRIANADTQTCTRTMQMRKIVHTLSPSLSPLCREAHPADTRVSSTSRCSPPSISLPLLRGHDRTPASCCIASHGPCCIALHCTTVRAQPRLAWRGLHPTMRIDAARPACSLAAGPATVYRNYFADTNGEIGQSAGNQLNNLGDLLDHVGPTAKDLLKVKNGYVSLCRASAVARCTRGVGVLSRGAPGVLVLVLVLMLGCCWCWCGVGL